MYPAAAVGSVCRPCGGAITGRKHAWMLGFERKRTNPHEKYDHPNLEVDALGGFLLEDRAMETLR